MTNLIKPQHWFYATKIVGFMLLFTQLETYAPLQYIFLLVLVALSILRLRFEKLHNSIYVDLVLCFFFIPMGIASTYTIILVIMEAIYRKHYLAILGIIIIVDQPPLLLFFALACLCAFALQKWEEVIEGEFVKRFSIRSQLHDLATLNDELATDAKAAVHKATLAERARISRDIHDHAAHDIIAAYMSFQTMQDFIEEEDVREMFELTLARLESGVGQIRDILHNVMPAIVPGIKGLETIAEASPVDVTFQTYGNTAHVPAFVWQTLESCLKESLTNVTRHSLNQKANVQLDVTEKLVRFYMENEVAPEANDRPGRGLSNLRYRVNAVGGNLSVSAHNGHFKLICVIPIGQEKEWNND